MITLDDFVAKYPYTDFHELNQDWILAAIRELTIKITNFVSLNTIKYADPIQWNITTQYEANTVVIDPISGTAYISTHPVPSGVSLSNTDYWTVVFTLDVLSANQNITFRNDGTNVIATFASDEGDWLLWNSELYKVTQPIALNTAYVVGYNIERYTVELFIKDYIDVLAQAIGDLDDLNTTDKSSLVNAINELLDAIGDLDDLDTTDKSSLVNAINEVLSELTTQSAWVIVDDTMTQAEIQDVIDNNYAVKFSKGTYYIDPLDIGAGAYIGYRIPSNRQIWLDNCLVRCNATSNGVYQIFFIKDASHISIYGPAEIRGDKSDHLGYTGEFGDCLHINNGADISVRDITFTYGWGDGVAINGGSKIYINNILCDNNRRNGLSIVKGNGITIENSIFTNTSGTAPEAGLAFEAVDATTELINIVVKNCRCIGNNSALGWYVTNLADNGYVLVDGIKTDKTFAFHNAGANATIIARNCESVGNNTWGCMRFTVNNSSSRMIVENCIWHVGTAPDLVGVGGAVDNLEMRGCKFFCDGATINSISTPFTDQPSARVVFDIEVYDIGSLTNSSFGCNGFTDNQYLHLITNFVRNVYSIEGIRGNVNTYVIPADITTPPGDLFNIEQVPIGQDVTIINKSAGTYNISNYVPTGATILSNSLSIGSGHYAKIKNIGSSTITVTVV